MTCSGKTKSGAPCGWRGPVCPHHPQKGGTIITDAIRAIKDGPSEGPDPNFMKFLTERGLQPIEGLWVGKRPLKGYVKAILNAASLGGVSQAQKMLGYDNIWHFYIIVVLQGQGAWVIEKNTTVEARPINPSKDMSDVVRVLIPAGQPTLYQFLKNAVDKYGDKAIWKYNPTDANCQWWVASLLNSNNMVVPTGFDPQNAKQLLSGLPGGGDTAKKVVDVAAMFDRFRKGYGASGCACEQ